MAPGPGVAVNGHRVGAAGLIDIHRPKPAAAPATPRPRPPEAGDAAAPTQPTPPVATPPARVVRWFAAPPAPPAAAAAATQARVVRWLAAPAQERRPSPRAARRPAPPAAPRPEPTESLRPPDISRFLEASEPQPEDDQNDPRTPVPGRFALSRGSVRTLVKLTIVLVIAAVAAVVLRTYVVAPYFIPSESMEPTLHGCTGCSKDHILVDKFSYRFHDPHQSDIVVFDRPKSLPTGDDVLIKRVIAIPGDRVALRDGLVFVNGRRLVEPYLLATCGPRPSRPETGTSRWRIPADDVFVMGDNRCNSTDSRTFGPIPESSIVGRAFAITWPLKRIGSI